MPLSPNGLQVLKKRYLLKDEAGNVVEDAPALFWRVAKDLAAPDRHYGATDDEVRQTAERFYILMSDLDFLPNSPTLANAGARKMSYSACFVLPVPDDLGGIFETIKVAALIHQTGGGTGFAFSRLRPKNDRVGSTKGVSSGPISFMDVFNAATESIKQGGMRRGANMGILRIDHPDVLEFIAHKEDLSKLTNFNISVAVTDAFMAAVEAGTTYDLVNPRTGEKAGELDAREVFRTIVQRAWRTGEPGLVFIDRMNRYCPVPWMGSYEATNPCGEQPLIPYESCNLGSINLERFVVHTPDGPFQGHAIDWHRLRHVVHVSTHLLDNVIDANHYPHPEIARVTKATRKIGLGVMGFGRLLFKLGVPYGSPKSQVIAEQVMSFIDYESKVASVELAKQRGSFPARETDVFTAKSNAIFRAWCEERRARRHCHPDADFGRLADRIEKHGIRNSTTTTIAPTGTISMIADTSGGCEPVFALTFKRFQADTHMLDSDDVFKAWANNHGFHGERLEDLMAAIDANHGTLQGLAPDYFDATEGELTALERAAGIFRTAHDIGPSEHVQIQAAFQHYNDSATSKTINFPEEATQADVETAYRLAWELGCKGITVYRNNSREFQPLSTSATPAAKAPNDPNDGQFMTRAQADAIGVRLPDGAVGARIYGVAVEMESQPAGTDPHSLAAIAFATSLAEQKVKKLTAPRERPEDLHGFTRITQTAEGKLVTTVNYDAEGAREVVANIGRSGGVLHACGESIGRLVSLALKFRVPVDEVARALVGIRGGQPFGLGRRQVLSIPDAIGKVLASAPRQLGAVTDWHGAPAPVEATPLEAIVPAGGVPEAVAIYGRSPECAECGGPLQFAEGCEKCPSCLTSKCG